MPNGDGKVKPEPEKQMELASPSTEPQVLPPVVPPQTTAPFQLNQQFNVQQIPPKVWDKLSAEQIFELSRGIIDQVERMDERRFENAKQHVKAQEDSNKRNCLIGGLLALVGLLSVTYLATHGQSIIAGIVGTFLATIIAVVIGRNLSD